MIHLICQGFAQDFQVKNISDFQFRKIGKHSVSGHAAMTGEDGVCAFAAYRERASKQVADANFQCCVFCTMVDRQDCLELWDIQIPHQSVAGKIQQILVFFGSCLEGGA